MIRRVRLLAAILALTTLPAVVIADCCHIPIVSITWIPIDQKPPLPPVKPPPIQQDDKKPPTQDGGDILNPIGPEGQTWFSKGRGRTFREPVQQAVIAWNGSQELLIINVQQQSVFKAGAVLSVLPLPGKPISVKRADPEVFTRAFKMYRDKLGDAGRAIGRDLKVLIEKISALTM